MIISVPRLTIRIHDNPLLQDADMSIYFIQKHRTPGSSKAMNAWSFHQFNLLLQMLKVHQEELGKHRHAFHILLVDQKEQKKILSHLHSKGHDIITDVVTDPSFKPISFATEMSTHTLIDWTEPENTKFIKDFWEKSKIYGKLDPIKRHVVAMKVPKPDMSIRPKKSIMMSVELRELLSPYEANLSQMLDETQALMREAGMTVHKFPSTEKTLLSQAKKAIAFISNPKWYKPKTSVGLEYMERSKKPLKNSSQLSPLLSVGALSPRFFWHSIRTTKTDMGSGRDQLLFRESFHTVALAHKFGAKGRVRDFWSNNAKSAFTNNDYKWKTSVTKELRAWQNGELKGAFKDTNDSMKSLWNLGWIHHLRRHLVADVLTRGKLGIHWQRGEQWFRHTLIDHDAVVNRCNWMWLAAVAFSSKQKVYHYNANDYVRRNT